MSKPLQLLAPSARPLVALGGDNAWKQRNIRGITCSFQWLDLSAEGFESANACMCLFNAYRNMDKGAYVIPQQHGFLFGTREGNPTAHLATTAFSAAQQLGFDMRDKSAIRQIIDIIIEGLPDLILMPSEPPDAPEVIVENAVKGIEATAKLNGKIIHQELL